MACSYNSVVIPAQGQFILPPGAEVVAVSDTTALSAGNNCADLSKLETPQCWLFQWEMQCDDGATYDAWEGANFVKLVVGGVEYGLSASSYLGEPGSNELKDLINNNIPALRMGTNASYGTTQDGSSGSDCRIVFWCSFYTIPSIAAQSFLHIRTNSATHGGTYVIIPARDQCSGYVD
jgi:hypothetical protein